MTTVLGIESTAHTFGIGIVRDGEVLSNVREMYTTESGGIVPVDSAKHHRECGKDVYFKALNEAGIKEDEIDAIAFSNAPGLAPCLLEGMKFAKELSERLKKPLVGVNHCIAHLEIGGLTGAEDPVMLYVSGANTQIIAYSSGKYRIFGETLDLGVGNFIDTFARYAGIGFPGGPKIEKLAKESKNYIELPYKVKGMDIALSGIQTKLRRMVEKLLAHSCSQINGSEQTLSCSLLKESVKKQKFSNQDSINSNDIKQNFYINKSKKSASELVREKSLDYTLSDLAYSMQETVFAMLVETAERALAHIGKRELLLGGGVACNSRLQEMCKIMCKERGAKFFCPPKDLLVDNGGMIAYLGEIMFRSGIKETDLEKVDIKPRERTDDVGVGWR